MSTFLSGFSPAVLTPAGGGVALRPIGDFQPAPTPSPGLISITPGSVGGALPTVTFVQGTAASETIELARGGIAFGAGGDDTFVVKSAGGGEGSEFLGSITDFNAGDTLDLSQLGAGAAILERKAGFLSERLSIDFNGDGKEDGHLFVSTGERPDFSDYKPMPMPDPGAWSGGELVTSDVRPIAVGQPIHLDLWI